MYWLYNNIKEWFDVKNSVLDNFDLLNDKNFFLNNFHFSSWKYDNGELYGEIVYKKNSGYYLRYRIVNRKYYLDTIYAPWDGAHLLLALFQLATTVWIDSIYLNARTNDEWIKTQKELENWYRKFWFDTISTGVAWTSMMANIFNRPLSFRLEEVILKVNRILPSQ